MRQRIKLKESNSKAEQLLEKSIDELQRLESSGANGRGRKEAAGDGQEEQPKMKARKHDQDEVATRRSAIRAMHEAVSSQQAKKRRQDAAAKVEDELSAIYEADPQLPGKQGGTQAILERLCSEARGRPSSAIATCSQKPCNNSKGEQLASQMGKNLLRQETAGRISKGEMHAINNILKGKPRE